MWGTFTRAQTEATIAQKELERVSTRNDRVLAEIAQLDDPRGREAELRRRFDVGRPGEKLLIVVEEQHPEIAEVEPITWYDRLKASLPLWAKW
jgi:cell division protein FtsB